MTRQLPTMTKGATVHLLRSAYCVLCCSSKLCKRKRGGVAETQSLKARGPRRRGRQLGARRLRPASSSHQWRLQQLFPSLCVTCFFAHHLGLNSHARTFKPGFSFSSSSSSCGVRWIGPGPPPPPLPAVGQERVFLGLKPERAAKRGSLACLPHASPERREPVSPQRDMQYSPGANTLEDAFILYL